MSRIARLLTLALACALTMGASCNRVREQPPVTVPVHTVTEKRLFVPITSVLTTPEPIAPAGLPSECPLVARERKRALESCNAKLGQIGAIQGTEVE